MTLLMDRELARWTRADGSTAVWFKDWRLMVRVKARGRYRKAGQPGTLGSAMAMLHRFGTGWRRCAGQADAARFREYHPPPSEVTAETFGGCVEVGGMWVLEQERSPIGASLARVAAYFLRAQAIEVQTPVDPNSPNKHNSRRSLFDEPLTLGEVAMALADPTVPLSDVEREAATEAMFGAEDGTDESDERTADQWASRSAD